MESFCQRCACKCDFHMYDIIKLVRLGKSRSIRYALEHWTGNLHSKFGPILTNTDRVLLIRAVSELV